MSEIVGLGKDLFNYFVSVGGLAFAVLAFWAGTLWWENRELKRRVAALADQLIEDGRDATDKLLEMSAGKLLNEASTSRALTDLAAALQPPPGKRR